MTTVLPTKKSTVAKELLPIRTILVNVGPLLKDVLEGYGESHGVTIEEPVLPRSIFYLPGIDAMSFDERNIRLVKTEAERIAENPDYWGCDVYVYHSTSTFRGKELGHPSTRADLREIILLVVGHVIQYHPIIGFVRIGSNGAVLVSHFSAIAHPIDVSVRKCSPEGIDKWLVAIPDDKIVESGPGGMPLAMGAFTELVESVRWDRQLYTNLISAQIAQWGDVYT